MLAPEPEPRLASADGQLAISVVIAAHNPNAARLHRVLESLSVQQGLGPDWELIVVDNASDPAIGGSVFEAFPALAQRSRVVREQMLGLSHARARGFREGKGRIFALVDDDNVLASDYLAKAIAELEGNAELGLVGGPVVAEFEQPPVAWMTEFLPLLALRDLPEDERIQNVRDTGGYPVFAPVGAGMVMRRACAELWLQQRTQRGSDAITDRSGRSLTSGGDNDIVLCGFRAGWSVGYFRCLRVVHLIPKERLNLDYLARLNEGIQHSWVQVLALHGVGSWPLVSAWGARLRCWRAWLRLGAWRSPQAYIRWRGACGHFMGRIRA